MQRSYRFAICFFTLALGACGARTSAPLTPLALLSDTHQATRPEPSEKASVLHAFGARPDGETPLTELLAGTDGEFYGTTYNGGEHGRGSVFEISSSGKERVLYSFKGGTDGENPVGGLTADSAGDLYGTTEYGGDWGACGQKYCGTVFELKRTPSKYRERLLYVFKYPRDGEFPLSGVLIGKNGVLYGTTNQGGNLNAPCFPSFCGTVFALVPNGKTYTKKTIYTFLGDTDGAYPSGALIANAQGVIYGTTEFGGETNAKCASSPSGTASCGTVYKVTAAGFETVIRRFHGGTSDGANPQAGLLAGPNKTVYGVTTSGGSPSSSGVVFQLKVGATVHTEKILYRFCSKSHCADGSNPIDSGGLRIDSKGNLYGTTQAGGDSSCGCGNVFMLRPSGSGFTERVLHDFTGSDGSKPYGSVVLAGRDVLGATPYGGSADCKDGCGVVYDIVP